MKAVDFGKWAYRVGSRLERDDPVRFVRFVTDVAGIGEVLCELVDEWEAFVKGSWKARLALLFKGGGWLRDPLKQVREKVRVIVGRYGDVVGAPP